MDIKAIYKRNISNYINFFVVIRIIVAAVLIMLADSLEIEQFISVIIMTAALIITAYDIAISAIDEIKSKNYLSYKCVLLFVCLVGFCMGCYKEAVLLAIFYQLGYILLNYVVKRTKATITDYVPKENTKDIAMLRSMVNRPNAGKSSLQTEIEPYLEVLTKAILVVAVLYAILMPIIADITYAASIRRALMLMLTAIPLSVVSSLPICSITGIASSAAYGVFIKNTDVLYSASKMKTVVFDKSDVFSDGLPKLVSITSPVFDDNTFIRLSAYIAYYSDQRIAAPIVSAYKGCVNPEIIQNFNDIPGCGMEITVRGIKIYLGTAELLQARGVELPEGETKEDFVLYMVIADRCAGRLDFAENISPYAEAVVADFRNLGDVSSILLTEDGKAASEKLANDIGVDSVYYECDSEKKLGVIEQIVDELNAGEKLMYVSAENLDFHTSADIDAKVGYASDNADMLMSNVGVFGLPVAFMVSKRTKQISRENIIFAFIVKIIMIILAFTGGATMWFIVFMELITASAACLNAARIPDESLMAKIKNKFNK